MGAVFSATAMVGAYLGGLGAQWFEGDTLLILFAVMMVLTGVAMLLKREPLNEPDNRPMSLTVGHRRRDRCGGGLLVWLVLVAVSWSYQR